jgi:hypothetical protein
MKRNFYRSIPASVLSEILSNPNFKRVKVSGSGSGSESESDYILSAYYC